MRRSSLLLAIGGLGAGAALIALLPESAVFSPPRSEDVYATKPGERWACPMMDFIGNRPGDCPVCGMTMTKVTSGELTREQQRRMGVEVTRVFEGPAIVTVRAYGVARYDDRTMQVIIPRIAGRIVKRHPAALHSGTVVKAGDPVVDLYSPEAFAAQGELAAAIKLVDGPTVRALFERFERWNLTSVARAIIDGGAPTDTITITSPFSGLVILGSGSERMDAASLPRVGQEVMADLPLLRVVDPTAFILALQTPETRAHWIRVGQSVKLASDDLGELADVAAEVTWVAPELNAITRAREAHVHLRDPNHRLLAGSLISARFQVALTSDFAAADPMKPETRGRFVLAPKTAVLSTAFVTWRGVCLDATTMGQRTLNSRLSRWGLGFEDESGNDLYIIRGGLAAGDEIAAQGVFLIDSQAQLAGTPSLLFPLGAVAPASAHTH